MMDIRKRILIGVGIVAGIVIAVLLIYFYTSKEEAAPEEQVPLSAEEEIELIDQGVEQQLMIQVDENVQAEPYSEDVYAKQVARIFVERFGTYSNQSDNQHIEDVLELTTASMGNWVKTQAVEQSGEYIGVTTRVIASSVLSITDTMAEIELQAQRITETAGSEQTENLIGTIDLIKQNGDWKVDGLYWERQ